MSRDARRITRARLAWSVGIAAVLHGAVLAGPVSAQTLEYTGGVQSWTGEYLFTERTTSFTLLTGLSLDLGRLRLAASLPLLYQNSTAVTYVGGAPVPTGGPDAGAVRQREPGRKVPMGSGPHGPGPGGRVGAMAADDAPATQVVAAPGDYHVDVGDPLLQAELTLHEGVGVLRRIGVHALAKAPVADVESGVGTGEWDYGAGLSLGVGGARTFLLADASFWVVGDMPDLTLRNTLAYAVSVGRSLGNGQWSVLGSVLGATAMIERVDAPVSVGLGVGYAPRSTHGFNVGVSVGLTESAPDVSSFLGWRVALGRQTR